MIITRTPLRISFVGGGSDLPQFWRGGEVGAVVSATIDKYVTIAVNDKFDGKVRASYSVTENVDQATDLRHDLIREALAMVRPPFRHRGIEVVSIGDIPSGSGLGSSGAYGVGLLHALHVHRGQRPSADELAREACQLEVERCGRDVGCQDQYTAAFGGLRHYQFVDSGTEIGHLADVWFLPIVPGMLARLEQRLLLLYLGNGRAAVDVLRKYRMDTGVLRALAQLTGPAREYLTAGELDAFGGLLHEGWALKKRLSAHVTTPQIDESYNLARELGALGGKVCGAGGGGFLLLYAPEWSHDAIVGALGLRQVRFRFAARGSEVVYAG